jgi:TPP-dependent pyruvate/acetoin dehydrogenase alpha subunit
MKKEKRLTISREKPPVYDELHEKFGVEWNKGVIITYGKTVHCKYKIPKQKKAHERVHIKQQKDPVKWWKRYIEDVEFRREQEIEAYKKEVQWIRENIKGFKHKKDRIDKIVQDICSSMYGDMIGEQSARESLGCS